MVNFFLNANSALIAGAGEYIKIDNLELATAALLLIPVLILNYVEKTSIGKEVTLGFFRCFVQLMIVGYILKGIFDAHKWYWVVLMILVMLVVGGIESVRREKKKGPLTFFIVAGSLSIATTLVMAYGIIFILKLKNWYEPQYLIPMIGMLIGNSVNGASLFINRLRSEINQNREVIEAKLSLGATVRKAIEKPMRESITAAMIPTINYLMIIGLVTLPGMMTGQIIAGASPLDSVRYQIVIMYMISVSVSLSVFLTARYIYGQFFTKAHQIREEYL